MKSNNLELELRRYELSQWDDKISYEKHSYNGFLGIQGDEAYYIHLDEVYHDYFADLRTEISSLVISNNGFLLNFLNDKIILFSDIKADFKLKNHMDWGSYIRSSEKHYSEVLKNNPHVKNEYNTAKFFREMSETQLLFIDKAIDDLQKLHNNYNRETVVISSSNVSLSPKNKNEKLSDYIDDYFSKYSQGDTLTNKDLEVIFGKTRITIDNWKEQGKFIQISEEGKRPILYSKENVKNNIKNGILPHRLVDVKS